MFTRPIVLILVAGLCSAAPGVNAQTHHASVLVFDEVPQNFAVDPVAQRVFVPLRNGNRVAEIALTGELIEVASHAPGAAPNRVNLSADGHDLWVALRGSGQVARLDRASGVTEKFDVGAALGSLDTWDVMPGLAGEVYASASPSAGVAHVARLDLASGQATRVAGGEVVSLLPYFEIDRVGGWLYLGELTNEFTLRKLNANSALAPIVGTVRVQFGGASMSLKPDGSQIAVSGTSILWTNTLEAGAPPLFGIPAYRPDTAEIGVFSTGSITVRETTGYTTVRGVDAFPCGFTEGPKHFVALPRGDGWLLLSGNRLCKVESSDFVFSSGF